MHSMTCREPSTASTSGVTTFVPGRLRTSVPDGFTVIELNGVTSEATHIYDPRIGLLEAYRALFEQWRLAFEIGAENVRRGAETTSIRELVRLLLRYRETAQRHLDESPATTPRPITINAIVTSARAEQRINTSAR